MAELKKDKCFVKLTKKLQKDLDDLKRRHQKQRDSIQKQQVVSYFTSLLNFLIKVLVFVSTHNSIFLERAAQMSPIICNIFIL